MLIDRQLILDILTSFEPVRNEHFKLAELSNEMNEHINRNIDLCNNIYLVLDTLSDVLSMATGTKETIFFTYNEDEDTEEFKQLREDAFSKDFSNLFYNWTQKLITSEEFADGILENQKYKQIYSHNK